MNLNTKYVWHVYKYVTYLRSQFNLFNIHYSWKIKLWSGFGTLESLIRLVTNNICKELEDDEKDFQDVMNVLDAHEEPRVRPQ